LLNTWQFLSLFSEAPRFCLYLFKNSRQIEKIINLQRLLALIFSITSYPFSQIQTGATVSLRLQLNTYFSKHSHVTTLLYSRSVHKDPACHVLLCSSGDGLLSLLQSSGHEYKSHMVPAISYCDYIDINNSYHAWRRVS
jgi:hypothetical protein